MSFLLRIKNKLTRSDLYLRIRYHKIVLAAWRRLHPGAAQVQQQQADLYSDLLKDLRRKDEIIFDIGANEGFTTALFAPLCQQVIAVEPSPLNARILRARFGRRPAIHIIEQAVSDTIGTADLFVEERGTAFHTLRSQWKDMLESGTHHFKANFTASIPVPTITLASLLEEFECPAFIKIDTEGYERQVLSTLNKPVPLIIFEAILPQFVDDTIACIRHLQQLDAATVFNYAVDHAPVLHQYVDADTLIATLPKIDRSADIICRMSNYKHYYE